MVGRSRSLSEARCIGCALASQLRQVQISAGSVSCVHGLPEPVLRPEAVEDNGVDGDDDDLHNDLNDAADQTPILQSADKSVMNIVFKKLPALVVLAGPAPEVLAAATILTALQDAGADDPHDNAENKPADCKHGVVDRDLLGTTMTTAAVGEDDNHGEDE